MARGWGQRVRNAGGGRKGGQIEPVRDDDQFPGTHAVLCEARPLPFRHGDARGGLSRQMATHASRRPSTHEEGPALVRHPSLDPGTLAIDTIRGHPAVGSAAVAADEEDGFACPAITPPDAPRLIRPLNYLRSPP